MSDSGKDVGEGSILASHPPIHGRAGASCSVRPLRNNVTHL